MLRLTSTLLLVAVLCLSACGTTLTDPDDITGTETSVPDPREVTVPDLIGLELAEARSALRDRGLELEGRPAAIDEAIVVAQEPIAGVEVAAGSVVIVDARRDKGYFRRLSDAFPEGVKIEIAPREALTAIADELGLGG